MRCSIGFWQFAGFVFTSVAGTLLHFLFDWSGGRIVVGLFSAVNESIWEHMKLLFFPMLAFAVVQWAIIGKKRQEYWCVVLVGTTIGVALIPILFYTYSGIFGVTSDYVNITIFFVVAAVSYWLQARLFKNGKRCCKHPATAVAILGGMVVLFWLFTFVPPHIPLFEDPIKNTYGILQNI